MTFHAWGAAAVVVAASLLFGHAVNLLGFRSRAASPAVGFSLIIVVTSIAIKLPGNAVTAAVVLLPLIAASAVLAVVRRGPLRFPVVAVAAGMVGAFGAAIPFIANGRVGLPGVALDNDTAAHLVYAEGMRSSISRALYGVPGYYPLGPHSLADTIASGLGVRLDLAFTAVLISTVVVTALVGANALRNESGWKRVIAGALAALIYLVAAYYAEGAFKETMLGLLVLAFALQLEEVRDEWSLGVARRWRSLVPASAIAAAGVYVYSYPAIAWFGLTLLIWLAAEIIVHRAWRDQWRSGLRDILVPCAIAGGVLLILLLPIAGQLRSLISTVGLSPAGTGAITSSNVGNLGHALSPFEALGIWNSVDFRLFPSNAFHAGIFSAFALGVMLLGVIWCVTRRDFVLPAAIAACWIIYWRSNQGQSVYVTAKALVVAGPVVAVVGIRGLLERPLRSIGPSFAVLRLAAAAVFVILAGRSSYLALANEPVWPSESTKELLALDKLTRGQTVLFLGATDYAEWLFHDSKVSAIAPTTVSLGHVGPRPTKLNVYGTALDFDSVNPVNINDFQWFITTNTSFNSEPPPGVRLVRQLRMYQLWQRVGTIPTRGTIEPAGNPGGILDCHRSAGRALSRKSGVAAVMAPPVAVSIGAISPGDSAHVSLHLPAGRSQLSLQYTSAVDLHITAASGRWTMPAYTDRPGPVFAIGSIRSDGRPVAVTIHADKPSSLTGTNLRAGGALIAMPSPYSRTLMPLKRSCGRYIDWYRL